MVSLKTIAMVLLWLSGLAMYLEYTARITYFVPTPQSSAVLITGARRGLGLSAAKRLAKEGFHVFVNVRKEADAKKLREQVEDENIEPIVFDLMSDEGIIAAEKKIRDWCNTNNKLFAGLVNNAVDFRSSLIENLPMNLADEVLRLNFRQLLLTIKTFIPLLRGSKGRIINVSSSGADLPFPGYLLYSTSKAFMDALTSGLRQELAEVGVAAINMKPGVMKSEQSYEFVKNVYAQMDSIYPPPYAQVYKVDLEKKKAIMADMIHGAEDLVSFDNAMIDAMLSPKPRSTYQMGGGFPGVPSKVLVYLAWFLPESIFIAILRSA